MITPGASAISALLGGPAPGEPGTAGPAGLLEPFASFLAAATLGEAVLGQTPLPAAEGALGEPLSVPLNLAGEQPPALETLSALVQSQSEQHSSEKAPPGLPAAPPAVASPVASSAPTGSTQGTPEAPGPIGPLGPAAARQPEGPRTVPGIAFPAEAAGPTKPTATPLPIVEPVSTLTGPIQSAEAQTIQPPTIQPPTIQAPVSPTAAAPAGPSADVQAAPQAGLPPATESGDAPEAPRPVAPGVGMDGAPPLARAVGGQPAGPAPALMDATIQRIVAIAEQSAGTGQRAMVVELPDTDGARLLVSMRGEAVHVTVASQGSGLPGQSWLSELATALTTRGFVPEGLLADGNGGRRSPYQPQDDPPPPRPSDSPPRHTQRSGISL